MKGNKQRSHEISRRKALKQMGLVALGMPVGTHFISKFDIEGFSNLLENYKERYGTTGALSYFKLKDVTLLPSDFKKAEQLDIAYMLEMDVDRLLAPFLRESGIPHKKESYGNWESDGLDGHIAGHYLSALSCAYASTGDDRLKNRLNYMLETLKSCQDRNGNGYIGGVPGGKQMWKEIENGKIEADGFSLNGKWVPLYNIHKTYAGLKDAYLIAEVELAKEMLVKMTDWAISLIRNLNINQVQEILFSEHGGLNEIFADVSFITGDPGYLELAKKFNHHEILRPLVNNEDQLTGKHANTQIPKVIGFKRISELNGDADLKKAAFNFWEYAVSQRAVAIGGAGVAEHFGFKDDFTKTIYSIEGPETCVTYNYLKLAKMLYQTDPQIRFINYYERALYSHILSTQHPKTGGLVYFTQMRPNHYRVYSQPETSMWCCVGSGIENHVRYGDFIYSYRDDDLYVNLFIPSKLKWKEKGILLLQENEFPYQNKTGFKIVPKKNKTSFRLNIRIPGWTDSTPELHLNGHPITPEIKGGNWLVLDRKWNKGDQVEVTFAMEPYVEQLPDGSNFYSFLYGPVVLGAKTTTEDLKGLFADESRMGHVAQGKQIPLAESPILSGTPSKIAAEITKKKPRDLVFTLTGVRIGQEALNMTLEPFYKIHDSRYMLYWPQAPANRVEELQKKLRDREKKLLALDERTVDMVACGEQQPESDHYIAKEESTSGAEGEIRWRETKKWFTYQMKNKPGSSLQLYVEYFSSARRKTKFLIEDYEVGEIGRTDNLGEGAITSILFELPIKMEDPHFLLKVENNQGSEVSHKIIEIRIMEI